MEAKLPDVNAGIVTHRKAIMNAYDKGDFIKCAISFDGIMALLPDEYRPEINTEKYYETVREKHIITCDICKTEYQREKIRVFELDLSIEDQCILGIRRCMVWTCLKCENTRPLIGSNTNNEKFQKPFYTGIIPEMPVREGLHDRIGYSRKFKEWYQTAFREIENKIGLYRAEYASQNPQQSLPNLDDA